MIDPNLPFLILVALIGVGVVASTFAPGLYRRALIALIVAVFMSPAVVVGHGIGITLALRLLLYPEREGHWEISGLVGALVPMVIVWIIAFGLGSAGAFALRSRAASRPAPDLRSRRREWLIVVSAYAAFALMLAASVSYRLYAREFKTTYGPFVVTIDTGPRALKDIVTYLRCGMYPVYAGQALLESGKPHEFPRKYLPGLGKTIDCNVIIIHPDLAPNFHVDYPVTNLAPGIRITLPTVSPPLWSDARYRRIVSGEEIPPGSNDVPPLRRAEIAVYDDWTQLAIMWVPLFCKEDFARIQREYLPSLAARRDPLFLARGAAPPQEDAAAIVLAGWTSSCDFHARNPQR